MNSKCIWRAQRASSSFRWPLWQPPIFAGCASNTQMNGVWVNPEAGKQRSREQRARDRNQPGQHRATDLEDAIVAQSSMQQTITEFATVLVKALAEAKVIV